MWASARASVYPAAGQPLEMTISKWIILLTHALGSEHCVLYRSSARLHPRWLPGPQKKDKEFYFKNEFF